MGVSFVTGPYWLPPTDIPVLCGTEEHALRWSDGELTALDHDDIDGELALGALGGEQVGCARIISAWRTALQEPRLLTLASRGKSDQLAGQPFGGVPLGTFGGGPMRSTGPRRAGRAQLMAMARPALYPGAVGGGFSSSGFATTGFAALSYATPAVATGGVWASHEPPEVDPLALLLHMPALRDRLQQCVIAAWSSRLSAGTVSTDVLPTLTAALVGRMRWVTREWLGDPKPVLKVEMLAPGASPTFDTNADGSVRIGVPFAWLQDVWAADLSTIFGRLTLAADKDGNTVTLDTVGPDRDRAPIVIHLP